VDKTIGLPRLPRSKFDRTKHLQHVARFDHYCGWVAATIGEENYRLFLLFVATQFGMCVYGTVLLCKLFAGEIEDKQLFQVTFFDKASGKEYPADNWVVFQYMFHRHMYAAGILTIMAVMAIALAGFLGYHGYITSIGMTTNESYKWAEVRKWHKSQVKIYQEYQKQQQTLKDGSPTSDNGQQHHVPQPVEAVEDPGPMPKNIYNRGFIENWKEVMFPKSLQRKAEASRDMMLSSKCTPTTKNSSSNNKKSKIKPN
jgi:palmitoyltransferase ZDHHC4